jgi:hypothetical protein
MVLRAAATFFDAVECLLAKRVISCPRNEPRQTEPERNERSAALK